jgi:hypothetical protein
VAVLTAGLAALPAERRKPVYPIRHPLVVADAGVGEIPPRSLPRPSSPAGFSQGTMGFVFSSVDSITLWENARNRQMFQVAACRPQKWGILTRLTSCLKINIL